jgi:hypothetical protein
MDGERKVTSGCPSYDGGRHNLGADTRSIDLPVARISQETPVVEVDGYVMGSSTEPVIRPSGDADRPITGETFTRSVEPPVVY